MKLNLNRFEVDRKKNGSFSVYFNRRTIAYRSGGIVNRVFFFFYVFHQKYYMIAFIGYLYVVYKMNDWSGGTIKIAFKALCIIQ